MLTFSRDLSVNRFKEEGGKGISCLSRKSFVCNWLATTHSNSNQMPLTKEGEVMKHHSLNVLEMLEATFPSKERGRTIAVWSVKGSTFYQRKQLLTIHPQGTRQLSNAASVMFTCALGLEDQIVFTITIQKRTLPVRNNK